MILAVFKKILLEWLWIFYNPIILVLVDFSENEIKSIFFNHF